MSTLQPGACLGPGAYPTTQCGSPLSSLAHPLPMPSKVDLTRIRYVSLIAPGLGTDEIDRLVITAQHKNAAADISGILIAQGGVFFQIFEGPVENVRALQKRLRADHRHRHMVVLREDQAVPNRLFADWAMRSVQLDHEADHQLRHLGRLLHLATDPATVARQLDAAVWQALTRHPLRPATNPPASPGR